MRFASPVTYASYLPIRMKMPAASAITPVITPEMARAEIVERPITIR